jgi:hypothetical protein
LEQELGKEYLSEVMITPDSATVGLTLDQLEWAKRQDATTVGGMISFGFALEKTGAAAALAHAIVGNFQWAGPSLILGAMLLFTVTLTQIIENAAVAIVLAPIA